MTWKTRYALLVLTWGSSFWFIKLGLLMLTPTQVAFGRTALGAVTLLLVSGLRREGLIRDRRTLGHLFVLAVTLNSAPSVLYAFAETEISSVLAAIMNATTPLATLLVMFVAFREQRPTRMQMLGLGLGFVGVAVVLGVWQGFGSGSVLGILACVLAVTGYGVAFPYAQRHLAASPYSRTQLATAQLVIAALQLLPVQVLVGGAWPQWRWDSGLAMLALGALGTGFAYVWNYQIIAAVGPSTASTVTYWQPLVAIAVGILALGEQVHWYEPLGTLVLLLGVAVSQGRLRRG